MSLKSIVQAYQSMYEAKKAAKDYDGDGKIESGTDEYMGSRDKAIKKAMAKKGMKKEEIENVFAEIEEHHQKDADGNVIEHDENPRPEEEIADDLTPASVEEGSVYGMYKGSGKPSGAMAGFAKEEESDTPKEKLAKKMKTKKELYINGFTNKIDILTSIKETIQEGSYVYAEDMLNQLIDYEEEDAKSKEKI